MSYARWLGKGFWGKHLKRRARTCHFFFISPPSQPLGTGVPGPRTLQTVRGSGHGRCETVRRRPVPLPCMGLSATGPTRTCQQQIPPGPLPLRPLHPGQGLRTNLQQEGLPSPHNGRPPWQLELCYGGPAQPGTQTHGGGVGQWPEEEDSTLRVGRLDTQTLKDA